MPSWIFLNLWVTSRTATVRDVRPPCDEPCKQMLCLGGKWKNHQFKGCYYFNFSSKVLNRTSTKMWGRWHLAMFLIKDGLFTLIHINSLMFWLGSCPSPYYAEIINGCWMACGGTMVINVGGRLQVFFEPFSECSWRCTNIHTITVHPATHEPVYHSTHFGDVVFILGSHKKAFDDLTSFKVHLYHTFSKCFLKTFCQFFYVWDIYMGLFLFVNRCILVLLVVTVDISIVLRTRLLDVLEFPSVYCLFRLFTFL